MGWFEDQLRQRTESDQKILEEAFFNMASVVMGKWNAEWAADQRMLTRESLDEILKYLSTHDYELKDLEITRAKATAKHNAGALITVRIPPKSKKDAIADVLRATEGVVLLEML